MILRPIFVSKVQKMVSNLYRALEIVWDGFHNDLSAFYMHYLVKRRVFSHFVVKVLLKIVLLVISKVYKIVSNLLRAWEIDSAGSQVDLSTPSTQNFQFWVFFAIFGCENAFLRSENTCTTIFGHEQSILRSCISIWGLQVP